MQISSLVGTYTNGLLYSSGLVQSNAPKAPESFDDVVKEMVTEYSNTNAHGDTSEISEDAYKLYNAENENKSVLYSNLLGKTPNGATINFKPVGFDSSMLADYANYV